MSLNKTNLPVYQWVCLVQAHIKIMAYFSHDFKSNINHTTILYKPKKLKH